MLEEYTVPALIIVFISGFLIGLNLGMICSRGTEAFDNIPPYAMRRENLPVRYPGGIRSQSGFPQQQGWSGNLMERRHIEQGGKIKLNGLY